MEHWIDGAFFVVVHCAITLKLHEHYLLKNYYEYM